MKKVILLVSFGTSHEDAGRSSLDKIAEELSVTFEEMPVIQAYTSGMIIRKLAARGRRVYTVEEAFGEALSLGAEEMYVAATHMIPGYEYHKLEQILSNCAAAVQYDKRRIKLTAPVLSEETDCTALVPVLQEILMFSDDYEYILMGHGTEAPANERYGQMQEAFLSSGLENVHMASLEGKPDLEDVISLLRKRKSNRKILLHPFMAVAGDHAKNDMAGKEASYLSTLRAERYEAEATVRGLGEYPRFRELYTERLRRLMR